MLLPFGLAAGEFRHGWRQRERERGERETGREMNSRIWVLGYIVLVGFPIFILFYFISWDNPMFNITSKLLVIF